MLLKFKLATLLCALGLVASSFAQLGNSCSDIKTKYFYKSSIDITESVLDCEGKGRSYSVFVALQEKPSTGTNQEDIPSFKVVDNKAGRKVTWGPGSKEGDAWMGWGIGVYKEKDMEGGIEHTAVIRVPVKGNFYDRDQSWSSIRIPCQKNNLQLKKEQEEPKCDTCGGNLLRSKDMKLEIQSDGRISISKKFDFKDGFQPRRVWCTS